MMKVKVSVSTRNGGVLDSVGRLRAVGHSINGGEHRQGVSPASRY